MLRGQELLVALDAGLALRLARAGRHANPLELVLESFLPLGLRLLLVREPLFLLLEPGRVVPFERNSVSAIELQDPTRDVVEKVPVVGDGDDRAGITLQVLLEPLNGLGVQMVRRLVEKEDVRFLDEEPAERDAALLAAREHVDGGVGGRTTERVHRELELGLEPPAIHRLDFLQKDALPFQELFHLLRGDVRSQLVAHLFVFPKDRDDVLLALLDDLANGLSRLELRLLLEVADGIPLGESELALIAVIEPGDDAEKRALPRAVEAEDSDLGAVEKGEIDVAQDLPFGREDPSHADERENDLTIVCHERARL